ncbi:MAG: hypothetical protein ACXAC5_02520 [Promethearchaeota archaeon]|jgi:hypothetical protein
MNWLQKIAQSEILLAPPGEYPGVGQEQGQPVHDGIARYVDEFGSYRYVYYVNGNPVSGLQVVSRDGKTATIANVFTLLLERRQKYATMLLAQAQQDFEVVEHAKDKHVSDLGIDWRDAQ